VTGLRKRVTHDGSEDATWPDEAGATSFALVPLPMVPRSQATAASAVAAARATGMNLLRYLTQWALQLQLNM
jgi:hypothetical protein